MQRYRALRATFTLLALFVLGSVLGGCGGGEENLNIDLRPILPDSWSPIGDWESVNIDDDAPPEYLLFYHYDASQDIYDASRDILGPIGAVIYDAQSSESADLSAGNLRPYTLLPSYRKGAGQGFVAPPEQTERVQTLSVTRTEPDEIDPRRLFDGVEAAQGGQPPADNADNRPDELILLGARMPIGGYNYISLFWWKGVERGYGSAQISAPGGVSAAKWAGPANQSPIVEVRAMYPQHDRSLLCKESLFIRRIDKDNTNPSDYRTSVWYQETPSRLVFCYGAPATPFYPEGTVLAYLLQYLDNPNAESDLITAGAKPNVDIQIEGFEKVDALKYFASAGVRSPAEAVENTQDATTVWATLFFEEAPHQRLYQFSLQRISSDSRSPAAPARWQIVRVDRES